MTDVQAAPEVKARPSFVRNTLIFSVLTGASRIAGLLREILAARYFGTGAAASAFTLAFAIPNVVRSLFADSALSAAFVPAFTELLESGRRLEAFQLATTLFMVMLATLGALVAVFVLGAPTILPLLPLGKLAAAHLVPLTVGLSQALFPIVLLLGLNGLTVGILQSYDHFSIPALSALVWNLVIIVVMTVARPFFHGPDQLYAYAIAIVGGTIVQFAMAVPVLRRVGFRLSPGMRWNDPRVRRVFALMLPVSLGLGLINFSALANSILGARVSSEAPSAIDKAFRLYMLPQGMFSVAIATVLFPQLSRLAARRDIARLRRTVGRGLRLIFLALLPATAATLVLATPLTRLVFQGGEFDARSTHLVSVALFWFSFSLPFSGINLLLTRTFFSLQRPWLVTRLSVANLVVNVGLSIALLPLGIGGIVIGTAIADAAMAGAQLVVLRRELDGDLELRESASAVLGMLLAAIWFGIAAYVTWAGIDWALGRTRPAQVVAVGGALAAGVGAYALVVLQLRIAEGERAWALVSARVTFPGRRR